MKSYEEMKNSFLNNDTHKISNYLETKIGQAIRKGEGVCRVIIYREELCNDEFSHLRGEKAVDKVLELLKEGGYMFFCRYDIDSVRFSIELDWFAEEVRKEREAEEKANKNKY
jgi:hypothetical protein